jgi:hypothetical protein
MNPFRKRTTPNKAVHYFDPEFLPFTHSKDFLVVSLPLGEVQVYGINNRLTGHTELMFSQLSQAVIQMQTCQQTLDRVRTGEANGYFEVPNIPSQG